jgi:hypothetical protein
MGALSGKSSTVTVPIFVCISTKGAACTGDSSSTAEHKATRIIFGIEYFMLRDLGWGK